ncbi:MAG: hypothetical protein ACC661_12965, partial [Verrucomicrobiales bacterium]
VKLHEIDHGRLPGTLGDLVPEYLAETPLDPYNGKSLSYDPKRRMAWSVGEDLMNAGGEMKVLEGREWRREPTLVIPE